MQAARVEAGSVPVGAEPARETLSISATRKLSITGPLTDLRGGRRARDSAVDSRALLRARRRAPSEGRTPRARRHPARSGTVAIARSVFPCSSQPLGARIAAGQHDPAAASRSPRPTPARSSGMLSIPTSAGTRTVTVSGYGTAPGLLLSASRWRSATIDTGAGGKALSFTLQQQLGPA